MTLLLVGTGGPQAGPNRDPKALEIAGAVGKAAGPEGAWQKVAALRFTVRTSRNGKVESEFHHLWDVRTGRYRLDWTMPDGAGRCALFDVATKEGKIYQHLLPPVTRLPGGGQAPIENPSAPWFAIKSLLSRRLLESSYRQYRNDTWWLLMPVKAMDADIDLAYDGESRRGEQTYDVLKLGLPGEGGAHGGTYWAYVNRATHRVDRWECIVPEGTGGTEKAGAPSASGPKSAGVHSEDGTMPIVPASGAALPAAVAAGAKGERGQGAAAAPAGAAPSEGAKGAAPVANAGPAEAPRPGAPEKTAWVWKDYRTVGPLTLSTLRSNEDGTEVIEFRDVEILSEIPAGSFDPPK